MEPFGAPGACFCRYFFHRRPTEKTRKKHLLPERPKILKIRRPGDLWSHFGRFLDPFWRPCFVHFPDRLNLVICNKYNAKTSFFSFQASHFSIKNRSTNHVFFKPLLGPPFSHFFFDFFQKWSILGPPLKIQWGQQSAPGPLKDPAERVSMVFASRCFPILHCTLPHITFSFVISLGKCICRSPCDSRRAKREGFGSPAN